jgi:ABC-type antimicrobial peptide transport system permease subunit
MNLLVRTSVLPRSISSAVRAQISAVDADQPVTDIQTVEDLVDGSRAQPRFTMLLLGIFSLTAVGLAVIGIYGVLAYSVAERRRELGIRLALGAERADVLLLVVRQGLMLAAGGIAIGLVAALLLTRSMASLLYGVGAHDPATFAVAPMLFLCVALLASYLPAQRATKVDPAKTLRES